MGQGPPATVLVVDDESDITDILCDYLTAADLRALCAADGPAALEVLRMRPVDAVVLDVMMPGMDGFETCRRIRRLSRVPVLFLTARDAETDKLRGLGLGEDYIVKTASPAEIVARVRNVLRRGRTVEPDDNGHVLDFGRVRVDVRAHEVEIDGRPVPMTPREFALLRLLAEHPRRVFTRGELFDRLWGDYGDQGTVWVHIRRLREKMETDPTRPVLITTVRGVGYRFEGNRR